MGSNPAPVKRLALVLQLERQPAEALGCLMVQYDEFWKRVEARQ